MIDQAGRTIDYLRLSVTDLCNYRCAYCMPETGVCKREHGEICSIEELAEMGAAAVACGVKKIRLTGGEPLVRRGVLTLCERLRELAGLRELAVTTNGSLLPAMAADLRRAGVDRLNISLDTLRPDRFSAITRRGALSDVLAGLASAEVAGFTGTKINVVLLGGINSDEIPDFVELTRQADYAVRFIELMPMSVCADWPAERFVSAGAVLRAVPELVREGVDGVSEVYRVPGYRGTVGLIRPMSCRFCAQCSRIRITSQGTLKPCLHDSAEIPLRGLHGEALSAAIRAAAYAKPERHHLVELRRSQAGRDMNEIGG